MRILVAGAGPAGLYFAYLVRRAHPDWDVRVVEQNPRRRDLRLRRGVLRPGARVPARRRSGDLRPDHAAMEAWTDLTVVHRGTPVVIDGIGFSAIGRLKFLRLLRQQAGVGRDRAGVWRPLMDEASSKATISWWRPTAPIRSCGGRATSARRITPLTQQVRLVRHPQAVRHAHADLRARTSTARSTRTTTATRRDMSTFVFECDAATWERAGFARMGEAETLRLLRNGSSPDAARRAAGVEQVDLAQLSRTCATGAGPRATSC